MCLLANYFVHAATDCVDQHPIEAGPFTTYTWTWTGGMPTQGANAAKNLVSFSDEQALKANELYIPGKMKTSKIFWC
jgi:hypothetical protein